MPAGILHFRGSTLHAMYNMRENGLFPAISRNAADDPHAPPCKIPVAYGNDFKPVKGMHGAGQRCHALRTNVIAEGKHIADMLTGGRREFKDQPAQLQT